MKALSMPITSPGRPEKFPPPLKKFSRNNVGSSSRSKSLRSSPIFYRRNAAGMIGISAAQEPYSPRVTCIGQVRARKSGGGAVSRRRRRCWFVKGKFLSRFCRRRRAFGRILCKWVVFFKGGHCKKVEAEEDCLSVGRKIEFLSGKYCENNDDNNNVEIRVREYSCCSDPPRNALMLTRSRALSLGERIWREKGENDGVSAESRIGQESGGDSENPRINNVGDNLEGRSVVLTRCKSEPAARTGEIN